MAGTRGRGRRLTGCLLLTLAAGAAGLLSAQSAASATTDLSTVVLSNTFPGMIAASPGAQNGPVNEANLQYLNESPADGAALLNQINKGEAAGYVRLWAREPKNGDAVVITAVQFQSVGPANEQLVVEDAELKGTPGTTPFSVPSIPLAVGYTVPSTSSTGILVPTHLVLFTKGDTFFQVGVLSQFGDLTNANAIALANTQAANASGSSSSSGTTSSAYRAGEIFSAVVLLLVMIWMVSALLRRKRKSRPATAPIPPIGGRSTAASPYPPPPRADTAPGWVPSSTNMNEQFFWDGSQWTGRRQWRGSGLGWVEEAPLTSTR